MAKKVYEESNIQEIGNALRRKLGNTRIDSFAYRGMEIRCNTDGDHKFKSSTKISGSATELFRCYPAAKRWLVNISVSGGSVYVAPEYYDKLYGEFPYSSATLYTNENNLQLEFNDQQCIAVKCSCSYDGGSSVYKQYGYHVQLVALDADGNTIEFTEESSHYSMKNLTMDRTVPNKFTTSMMGAAVDSIEAGTGTESTFTTKEITENGTYSASIDDGVDGYSSVTVDVQPTIVSKEFTENGVYYPSNDSADGYGPVTVNVAFSPALQAKTEYFDTNEERTVTADEGYDGLASVLVRVNVDTNGAGGDSGLSFCNPIATKLDRFKTVYTSEHTAGTNMNVIGQDSLSLTTQSKKRPSSSARAWYPKNVSVGDDITEKLVSSSWANSTSYLTGGYYQNTSSTPPTKEEFLAWGGGYTQGTKYMVYKYDKVNITENNNCGNIVLFNNDGICLFVGPVADALTALNNHEINITNGIFWCTDNVHSSTSSVYNNSFSFTYEA